MCKTPPSHSLQRILNLHWDSVIKQKTLPYDKLHHLNKIRKCRTQEAGGHVELCDLCGDYHYYFNSCGDRNCILCQGMKRTKWLIQQEHNLPKVPFWYLVFTPPSALENLFLSKDGKTIYSIFFRSVKDAVMRLQKNPKYISAESGFIQILETTGKQFSFHPHMNVLMTAGGITNSGKWKDALKMFSDKDIQTAFKKCFIKNLRTEAKKKNIEADESFINSLNQKRWHVHLQEVYDLKGILKYCNKPIMSNYDIEKITRNKITFKTFNKKHQKEEKPTMHPIKFIERFGLHMLPNKFHRIRYFGILNPNSKKRKVLMELSIIPALKLSKKEVSNRARGRLGITNICEKCGVGIKVPVLFFGNNSPPSKDYIERYIERRKRF